MSLEIRRVPPRLAVVVRGRMVHVRPRRGYVEALVFAGPEATGEPVGEWELPNALRDDLEGAARLAEFQTDGALEA